MSQDQNTPAAAENNEAAKIVINLPEGMTNVNPTEMSFFFRKDKETDTKRDTVKLYLPFLTVDGVVAILEAGDSKQIQLLLDQLNQAVVAQARVQVNDKEDITQDTLDLTKLSWEAIANLPQAERRGGGIAKEIWEEFFKDYATVMSEKGGKNEEQIGLHTSILQKKFGTIRANKKALNAFKTFLDTYASFTTELETFQDCVEFLQNKADTFLTMDDAALLENL